MRMLLLGVLAASRVLAQKVQIEFDQSVDFSKFTTFAIGDSRLDSKNPSLNNDKIRKRINLQIQKSLEAKGLTFVKDGASSLKVVYTLDSATKTKVEATRDAHVNTQVVMKIPYTEGKLVLGLRTPQSLVWRSVAQVESENIEGKLDDMVEKSIERYPPKPK